MNRFFEKLAVNWAGLGQFAASTPGHALIGAGVGGAAGAIGGGPDHRGQHALIGAGIGAGIGGLGRGLQGESLHKPAWEGIKSMGRLVNPSTSRAELAKSFHAMGNESEHAVAAMHNKLRAKPAADSSKLITRALGGAALGGVAGAAVGGEENRGRGALYGAALGGAGGAALGGPIRQLQKTLRGGEHTLESLGYRAGMEGEGLGAQARRAGLLGNRPVYDPAAAGVESVPWRAALNKVTRAVPGETALNLGFAGLGVHEDMKSHTAEGRERGMGERLLGTGMGAVTNLGTMHHGFIPMMAASTVGSMGGKYVGRGIDRMTGSGQGPPLPPEQVPT